MCPPDPLVGIYAAVTRRKTDGTPTSGWYLGQELTVAQAVHGYTVASARLGSIAPGKKADLVVLDKDIYRVDPAAIQNTRVARTVFDGRVVFEA